jgi:PKD repeat protein
MQTQRAFSLSAIVVAALAVASCTMQKQEAPPWTGPSGFGTTVEVRIDPDVLLGDGASHAVVKVDAFDEYGQPYPNLRLTVDTRVQGNVVAFGSLSHRTITTDSKGHAELVYTAPHVVNEDVLVDIALTPIGTNAANQIPRSAQLRLIPTGNPLPPADLVPQFTLSSQTPAQGQIVVFNAQTSTGSIVKYLWDFGDGRSAEGQTVMHAYSDMGSYLVKLTLVDPAGRTASATQSIVVGQSEAPKAAFTFSPSDPQPHDEIVFNASASTAAPGRRIIEYLWDFGDGSQPVRAGDRVTKAYAQERTYNVTLVVTDDLGRTGVVTQPVPVKAPTDGGGS